MVFVPEDFLEKYSPSSNLEEEHSIETSEYVPETLIWSEYESIHCVEQSKSIGVRPALRKRAVLTPKAAREIYILKKPTTSVHPRCTNRAFIESVSEEEGKFSSMTVSKLYGISPKSVRDIWNR
jgi:hypothetical protein